MGENQHVVKHPEGWAVRGEGNKRVSNVTMTQKETIEKAKQIAINQQSELLIHGRDGKIGERNSYGNDPFPPKN
jgi:uncharacterized protein YdaT